MRFPALQRAAFVAALAALAAIAAAVVSGRPASAIGPELRIGSTQIAVESQGTVTLEARDISGPGLGAWTVDVLYDPGLLSVEDCDPHPAGVCNPDYEGDIIRTSGASASGLTGTIPLLDITFECREMGTAELIIKVSVVADANEGAPNPISVNLINGAITCVPPLLPGDTDCDGLITAIDAELDLQLNARLIAHVPCPKNADVNQDGFIDALDALIVLQIVAGLL